MEKEPITVQGLEILKKELDELKNIHENKKFNLIKLHPSLNLCLQCGWLELSKDNKIITTKKF